MDSDGKIFSGLGRYQEQFSERLEQIYAEKGYETQIVSTAEGAIVVQIAKGGLLNLIGMSQCLNMLAEVQGEDLKVTLGKGKWLDKAVVMSISMVVLWPLSITSGIGFYKQAKFRKKLWESIDSIIAGL